MRGSDGIFELGYVPGGGHKNLKNYRQGLYIYA